MKIITWNVNSVRQRLEHLTKYLAEAAPDVMLLQELKCETNAFPAMEVEDLGYNIAIHGQKTFNGVAILSKHRIEDVYVGFDEQSRYIEAITGGMRVASVYVPNGQDPTSDKFGYKMNFFDTLNARIKEQLQYNEKFVIGGDYNVAPTALDVFDPKSMAGQICFNPHEHKKYNALMNLGLTNALKALHPNSQIFSWWDYRAGAYQYNKGMLIDHILLSPEAADCLKAANVDTNPRGWDKPSDHTPVWAEIA
jgi:exodeoxyribonuclease-3